MLQVLLLGSPEILNDGQLLIFQRRMVRHLLTYIASTPDWVSRSELATLFWPDDIGSIAYNRLRDTLRHLNNSLPEKDMLLKYGSMVTINPEKVYVDLRDFQNKMTMIRRSLQYRPENNPIPANTIVLMQDAVQLWRSPHFLVGINLPPEGEYSEWVIKTGQKLELDRQYLLIQLAEQSLVFGSPLAALDWMSMALQTDDMDPDLNQRYAEILVHLDRVSEARSHLKNLKQQYEMQNYGEFPSVLERLNSSLQNLPAKKIPDNEIKPERSYSDIPFVGGISPLKELQTSIKDGESLLVLGEAGSGKSRLLSELKIRAPATYRFMVMQPRKNERNTAFRTIGEMLRQSVKKEEWLKLKPEYLNQMVRLLPELIGLLPKGATTVGLPWEDARAIMVDALYQIMQICSQSKKVILVLDDAQWCDSTSWDVINYLVDKLYFRSQAVFILAARSEISTIMVEQFITDFRSKSRLQVIQLQPMGDEEINQITYFLTGEKPDTQLAYKLKRSSGGNPMFLIEILRAALSSSSESSIAERILHGPTTPTLTDIIHERLERLSQNERTVLNIAALCGDTVQPWLLEKVSDFSPTLLTDTLEILEKEQHLLQIQTKESEISYSFIHEKIRDAVVQDIYPPRKRLLHQRIAKVLISENSSTNSSVAQIAEHLEQAGSISQSIPYRLQAARFAWQVLSPEDSFFHLQHAENSLKQLDKSSTAHDVYSVYSLWGKYCIELNDLQNMQHAYECMLLSGEKLSDHTLIGAGLSGLGLLQAYTRNMDAATESLNRASQFLEFSDSVFEKMTVASRKAKMNMFVSNFRQAEQEYRQALCIYEDAGKPAECLLLKIEVTNELAFILSLTGKPSESIKIAYENLRSSDLEFDQIGKVEANIQIAIDQYYLGHPRQAIITASKSLELTSVLRNGTMIMYLHLIIARSALTTGKIAQCWQHLQNIKDLEKKYTCIEVSRTARTVCGELYSLLGAYKLAMVQFEDGSSSFSNSLEILDNRLHFGMMLRYQGEIQRGDQMVKNALKEAYAKNFASIYLLGELYDVSWYIHTGKNKEAQQLLGSYESDIASSDLSTPKLYFQLLKSLLAKNYHQLDKAKAFAQQVVDNSIELDHAWMELQGRRILWEITRSKREKQLQTEEINRKIKDMAEGIQTASISGLLSKYQKKFFNRPDMQ
jgi:DNA-binding SARP family transcriptional activator/energy-coupling factor transporter ATP-binding protein EcfA2